MNGVASTSASPPTMIIVVLFTATPQCSFLCEAIFIKSDEASDPVSGFPSKISAFFWALNSPPEEIEVFVSKSP